MQRSLSVFLSGRSFLVLLGLATVGPLVLALLHHHTDGMTHLCAASSLKLLTAVSAPHVFTTLYLLLDRQNLVGVARPGLTMGAAPLALMAVTYAVLLAAPLWLVLAYMLAYVHVSMWHFGRQNLGVVAFATRIDNDRAIGRFERWSVMAGVIAGVLGGYHIFAPGLMLNEHAWPLDLAFVDPVFSRLWYGGIAIYALLIPATALYLIRRRSRHRPLSALLYLACVFFFLPAYISREPLFLLVSWSVAHGAQYLVFLAFHAAGQAQGRLGLAALAPLSIFVLCLGVGVAIWRFTANVQDWGDHETIRLAIATTNALTLAHYWIDQFLWKFGNPERRAWLAKSYRFLRSSRRPAVA